MLVARAYSLEKSLALNRRDNPGYERNAHTGRPRIKRVISYDMRAADDANEHYYASSIVRGDNRSAWSTNSTGVFACESPSCHGAPMKFSAAGT